MGLLRLPPAGSGPRPWRNTFAICLLFLVGGPVLADQVAAIDPDARYPEGPLWRDGKLFYVEYPQATSRAGMARALGFIGTKMAAVPMVSSP